MLFVTTKTSITTTEVTLQITAKKVDQNIIFVKLFPPKQNCFTTTHRKFCFIKCGPINLLTLKSHLSCGLCEICQKFCCGSTVPPNEINLNLGLKKKERICEIRTSRIYRWPSVIKQLKQSTRDWVQNKTAFSFSNWQTEIANIWNNFVAFYWSILIINC